MESDIVKIAQETESFQREDAGDASMVSSEAQLIGTNEGC